MIIIYPITGRQTDKIALGGSFASHPAGSKIQIEDIGSGIIIDHQPSQGLGAKIIF
jgi:hypothetical protein